MATGTYQRHDAAPAHRVHPVWRPIVWSAVATAAIAALFSPLPAAAAPTAPAPAAAPAVPDSGSRPVTLGSLILPGRTTTVPAIGPVTAFAAGSPMLAAIEKKRADVALLGERLLTLREELTIAQAQVTTAQQKQTEARAAVLAAEQAATTAAANAYKDAAALPPGTIGSDLHGLEALAGIQRGEAVGEQAATRHLLLAREAARTADAEHATAVARAADLTAQHTRLTAQHRREEAALQKLEQDNAAAVAAEEAAQQARDRQLGLGYVGGESIAGKAADPRALAAVSYALAQRGDPYVWSEEGPDEFDCSGLMWAAYRTPAAGSYTQLPRVSRFQYLHTSTKAVDRYSLLPGDLLFFSSSNSWQGIHHVAMYVGSGMMVEAPRSRLKVRLVPVRWGRLFAATRVYGPVTGPARPVPVPPVATTSATGGTPGKTTKPAPGKTPPAPAGTTKPPIGGTTKPGRTLKPRPIETTRATSPTPSPDTSTSGATSPRASATTPSDSSTGLASTPVTPGASSGAG